MDSNLERVRAQLLLAADNWREISQLLERDLPKLIADIEQLQRELAEAKRYEGRFHRPPSEASPRILEGWWREPTLSTGQVAHTIGVTAACVRKWTLFPKINVVRQSGRLVRMPRTEIQRLVDEGGDPDETLPRLRPSTLKAVRTHKWPGPHRKFAKTSESTGTHFFVRSVAGIAP